MEKLFCPACDTQLVITHQERYQDMCEHVSQPNATPSMKDGYQCPNESCIAHKCDTVWIYDGDYFTGQRPKDISRTELTNALESKYGVAFAVGSWQFHYQLGKNAIKARTKEFKFWKYRVVVEPREKGHDYPLEEQYQPKRFSWKFEWWKRGSEPGCWQHLMPTHRMVSYYIRSFKSSYDSALYNPTANRSQIKEALQYATGYRWGTKDDRSFAKIASFIIRFFMPNKVNIIRGLAKSENITV